MIFPGANVGGGTGKGGSQYEDKKREKRAAQRIEVVTTEGIGPILPLSIIRIRILQLGHTGPVKGGRVFGIYKPGLFFRAGFRHRFYPWRYRVEKER